MNKENLWMGLDQRVIYKWTESLTKVINITFQLTKDVISQLYLYTHLKERRQNQTQLIILSPLEISPTLWKHHLVLSYSPLPYTDRCVFLLSFRCGQWCIKMMQKDGGWGWVIVAASFLVHLVTYGIGYSCGAIYRTLQDEFGQNRFQTAWTASILLSMTALAGNQFSCHTCKCM